MLAVHQGNITHPDTEGNTLQQLKGDTSRGREWRTGRDGTGRGGWAEVDTGCVKATRNGRMSDLDVDKREEGRTDGGIVQAINHESGRQEMDRERKSKKERSQEEGTRGSEAEEKG